MNRYLSALSLVLLGFSQQVAAVDLSLIDLEPGLWHLNVQMDVPGKGPQTGPIANDVCLRPADAAKLVVPPNSPCQTEVLDVTRQRLRIKLQCEQGVMRSNGEGIMVFGGRSLSSAMVIQTAEPYAMTIKQTMTGRYVGPCPANATKGSSSLKQYGR